MAYWPKFTTQILYQIQTENGEYLLKTGKPAILPNHVLVKWNRYGAAHLR